MIQIKTIEIVILAGTTIESAIKQSFELAYKFDCAVKFSFNGHNFELDRRSDFETLYNNFMKLTNPAGK